MELFLIENREILFLFYFVLKKNRHTLPCEDVRAVLSYTPLCAHSFFKFKRNGVPGNGLPFLDCIKSPILNIAMPELLSEHGNNTLNSERLFLIFKKKNIIKITKKKRKNDTNLWDLLELFLLFLLKSLAISIYSRPVTIIYQNCNDIFLYQTSK